MKLQSLLNLMFLISSLALITPQAFSQAPCKYVKEVSDPFSKKVRKGAQMAIGPALGMNEVLFEFTDGKLYFGLRIVSKDYDAIPFKKGDKVSFKLANDDLIEVAAPADVEPTDFAVGDVKLRQWVVMQEVSENTYKKLAASLITAVKYHLKIDYMIIGIKDRQVQKIMETAACILTNK